jgi:NAD(P)-dependent dehydrogenase (short-subunit alcohol dehydrogenase family)
VAVITGASRGLGAGLATSFAAAGLRLGLCARQRPALPAAGEGDDLLTRAVDVRDAEAVDQFARDVARRFGGLDLWINNAGVLEPIAPMRAIDPGEFADHLAINVAGVFHGSRAFVRVLREGTLNSGVLINISSGAGRHPYAGWAAYCAGKAAVDRFTEVVDLEERPHGLRAYAVAPGVIDTAMQAQIRAQSVEDFPLVERFQEMKQNNAFSTPAEVATGLLRLAFESPRDEVLVDLRS